MDFRGIELPSNRKFGFLFSSLFIAVSLYLFYIDLIISAIFFGFISIIFATLSLFKDNLLLPLNKLWMYFGMLIGRIMSPIILGMLFFFLITPIGIGMRIFRRDELRLKPLSTQSLWKLRNQEDLDGNSFNQQF
tara:strand:- start:1956 stop:2357 length:402 start_codon:yes stop_codon:yes gene_type:complete